MTELNKMLILIVILLVIMIIICGCEDKRDQEVVTQCELIGGSPVVTYCRNSNEICEVRCEFNRGE